MGGRLKFRGWTCNSESSLESGSLFQFCTPRMNWWIYQPNVKTYRNPDTEATFWTSRYFYREKKGYPTMGSFGSGKQENPFKTRKCRYLTQQARFFRMSRGCSWRVTFHMRIVSKGSIISTDFTESRLLSDIPSYGASCFFFLPESRLSIGVSQIYSA